MSKEKQIGLDAGCADMGNRKFFQTQTYVGMDLDADLLAKGQAKYPDVQTLNCKILNAPEISADFVQCIQVFVNAEFDKSEALEVTRKLITMVRPGGVLLMNTGKKTVHFDPEIKSMLESFFEEVVEIKYGNPGPKEVPIVISFLIATIMYFFPSTRLLCGHTKTYFKCVGKLP